MALLLSRGISAKVLNNLNLLRSQSRIGHQTCLIFARATFSTDVAKLHEEGFKEGYKAAVLREPKHFKQSLAVIPKSNQVTKSENVLAKAEEKNQDEFTLPHPIWSGEEADSVKITHRKPKGFVDHLAYYTVMTMRTSFDIASGYTIGKKMGTLDERSVLIRCIFLETVAGVPGFAAAMVRHLHSLRRMERDHGWIHTLLEEAENERMHLMTFMTLRRPGPIFRFMVIISQYIFTAFFSLAYLISARFCHRFVGYLEEQAVVTYTQILEELDAGRLPMWSKLPAPEIAIEYWQLPKDALMREVISAIRADEAHHRLVNHTLGSMKLKDENPFRPGA